MRWGRSVAVQLAVLAILILAVALILFRPGRDGATAAIVSPAVSARPTTLPRASASALPRSQEPNNSSAGAASGSAGSPAVARLTIARIGIRNAPIFDRGTDAKGVMLIAPGYAVTHYASSAGFGRGNTVLYGHDDIQGNIFGRLYDLNAGDVIEVSIAGQTQVYRVAGHQIVPPTAIGVLAPTADARLTIITCWPYNVDTKRWIVTAIKA